jgi:hypothetical protein
MLQIRSRWKIFWSSQEITQWSKRVADDPWGHSGAVRIDGQFLLNHRRWETEDITSLCFGKIEIELINVNKPRFNVWDSSGDKLLRICYDSFWRCTLLDRRALMFSSYLNGVVVCNTMKMFISAFFFAKFSEKLKRKPFGRFFQIRNIEWWLVRKVPTSR